MEDQNKNTQHRIFDQLLSIIQNRKNTDFDENSYTHLLFSKGIKTISKKLSEEATEVVIASLTEDKNRVISEISDLIYHLLVLMAEKNIALEEIEAELESRFNISGLEEKRNRK